MLYFPDIIRNLLTASQLPYENPATQSSLTFLSLDHDVLEWTSLQTNTFLRPRNDLNTALISANAFLAPSTVSDVQDIFDGAIQYDAGSFPIDSIVPYNGLGSIWTQYPNIIDSNPVNATLGVNLNDHPPGPFFNTGEASKYWSLRHEGIFGQEPTCKDLVRFAHDTHGAVEGSSNVIAPKGCQTKTKRKTEKRQTRRKGITKKTTPQTHKVIRATEDPISDHMETQSNAKAPEDTRKHTLVERKYRKSINDRISELLRVLPPGFRDAVANETGDDGTSEKKIKKAGVLDLAKAYITSLEQARISQEEEKRALVSEVQVYRDAWLRLGGQGRPYGGGSCS